MGTGVAVALSSYLRTPCEMYEVTIVPETCMSEEFKTEEFLLQLDLGRSWQPKPERLFRKKGAKKGVVYQKGTPFLAEELLESSVHISGPPARCER